MRLSRSWITPLSFPIGKNEALEQALQGITAYTWAVFTSPNGVEIFFQALQKRRIDIRTLAQRGLPSSAQAQPPLWKSAAFILPFCPKPTMWKALRRGFAVWSVRMKKF